MVYTLITNSLADCLKYSTFSLIIISNALKISFYCLFQKYFKSLMCLIKPLIRMDFN